MNKKKIFIVAGGTGGHVFPGIVVANALSDKYDIIWIASKNGVENDIVAKTNIKILNIDIMPFRKKGISIFKFSFCFFKSLYQSVLLLLRYKPFCIISFGGYVSFPMSIMAKFMGKKLVIHEQNKIAGLTNKILFYFANQVLTAYSDVLVAKKTVLVGNPIRQELLTMASVDTRYGDLSQKIRVLVVGGSLGARVFNQKLPDILGQIDNISYIIHQYGNDNQIDLNLMYQNAKMPVEKIKFINNMAQVYSQVDLVICRSGALTVSEIMNIGLAAIFIPYPYAVDNHQLFNILDLLVNNAAIMIAQKDLNEVNLKKVLSNLDKKKCYQMASRVQRFAIKDTIAKIVNVIDN
jgi:UDP-N-acetylglucosamine--N-acetylmuramyl-(pentapeptide) pyrophosphoryl-undecaprenol N-acetylglucosamine transferase